MNRYELTDLLTEFVVAAELECRNDSPYQTVAPDEHLAHQEAMADISDSINASELDTSPEMAQAFINYLVFKLKCLKTLIPAEHFDDATPEQLRGNQDAIEILAEVGAPEAFIQSLSL